jgi:phage shock protein E
MTWTILIVIVAFVLLIVWQRMSFVSEQTARELLSQGALVVDVRGPGEFSSGHLPGAVNVPLGELQENMARHAPDKNRALLLHCVSGARSGMARRQLLALGYRNAFNLGSYGRAARIVSGKNRRTGHVA